MVLQGHINSIDDIQHINEIASEQEFEVFISSGNMMFDARSFVALFNLIGKDVNIVVEDNVDVKLFAKMVKKMGI